MDLFDYQRQKHLKKEAPLAARMRPRTLEEFVGQEHIVGKNTLLYRAIKADKLRSIIFYGPPGTGKTTLAKIIANTTESNFTQINATTAGIKDIKENIEEAKSTIALSGKRTILFVDEIHRFNKTQQDTLLPYVEDGTVILIGATTENPYFEVNKALISRSIIFQLKHLSKEDIKKLLSAAIQDKERGLGNYNMQISEEALDFLSDSANGDARTALNAIELAALTTEADENGVINISISDAEECIQKRALNYDKTGDSHYDTISAFIKSMRGSDPDAALYYLARMLYAGEDPKFIARRIVICASEDVGNADPHALLVAVAAAEAVNFIGLPEGRIILSQAVTYVACAPKSNAAVISISEAMKDVSQIQISGIPNHLKDAHYKGAKEFGHGIDYKYAHDYKGNYVPQQYLPDELAGRIYYNPSDNGVEKKIKESLIKLRGRERNE
ncbi:AAA family ATPase [Anaeropeptidivorans aminofermentans]|jgi:putative ATPase|uniref:AAA family ATPase n=1 Tax=Anaeropeptidivorans aminofermentans TaxID=2934315 RepID=UPI0020257A17|nr:AAA family ATPase [Anaeropeptidivorans aminofermentans]MBE6011981.1 AAA family ATPase [Lachnospiraceae bacterium]